MTAVDIPAEELADGRHARRGRNRDAVVEALLELYYEGNLDPSSDEIAARAGLSPRSLFRYFDDVDDLCRSAISHQLDRVGHLVDVSVAAGASTAERIAALVDQRVVLFDAIGSVGHVSRLRSPFQPIIAEQLTQARRYLRSQIKKVMAPELAETEGARATRLIAAADVLCSFEAYQLLRHDQGLSRAKAIDVLVDALGLLFA